MKALLPPALALLGASIIFTGCQSSSPTMAILSWLAGGSLVFAAASINTHMEDKKE